VRLKALIFLSLFTWVGHPSQWDPFFFYLGRSLITMRLLVKKNISLYFHHRVGCLEKWEHSRNPSRFFFLSSRSPETIRPLAKPFSHFILHFAGHLEKWDLSQNPSRCFFLSGRLPGTIKPLAKPFSRFILHRAGRLEKWDHSRNPSRCFFLSGRSPGTIRPFKKNQKKSIKKKRKKEKRKGFHNYSSLQNLLYKVKRKLIF